MTLFLLILKISLFYFLFSIFFYILKNEHKRSIHLMRYFVQLLFILCLAGNLIGPSVSVLANAENDKQLICTKNGFEWVSKTTANEFYNQLALEVGIEADAFSDLDPKAPPHHSYSSGHCPLCIFELDAPAIVHSNYLTVQAVVVRHAKISATLSAQTYSTQYLQPEGRAPPTHLV